MRKLVIAGILFLQIIACEKEKLGQNPEPNLIYLDYILAGQKTGAGIFYSDILNEIIPFTYPQSTEIRLIDINNDGTDDLQLKFVGSASPGHRSSAIYLISLGVNSLAAPLSKHSLVDAISLNDTIGEKLNWTGGNCTMYKTNWSNYQPVSPDIGDWNNLKGKYIGARIFIDTIPLYAWLRVEISSGYNVTLIDFASTIGYEGN